MEKKHPLVRYSEQTGESIAAIATRAECSRMTLYRIIAGKQNATIDLLRRISAATGGKVSAAELLPSSEAAA